MTNEEIQQIFFLECEEALAAAEAGLLDCQSGAADDETVNAIFRSVHSIKGGAGAFGFTALQAFTHGFETLLSNVRDGVLSLSDGLTGLMLRAFDVLSDHVAAAKGEGPTPDDAALLAELAAACNSGVPAGHAAPAPAPAAKPAPAIETPVEKAEAPATAPPPPSDDSLLPDDDALDFDLDALIDDLGDAEADAPADWIVRVRPLDGALGNGGEPLLLLRELERLGGSCISVETTDTPDIDHFSADHAFLAWRFRVPGVVERPVIEEIFDFVGDDCELSITRRGEDAESAEASLETASGIGPVHGDGDDGDILPLPVAEPASIAAPAPIPVIPVAAPVSQAAEPDAAPEPAAAPAPAGKAATAPAAASQSIRIELNKLDRLIDTVGELVIAQAILAQRLAWHGMGGIDELAALDGLTRDIQESAMSIRAQPIQSVFSRVPRILRELEATTGKRVRLEVSGEGTELDKTVLERLGEPLTHLIRNAVDHGLESAEDRIQAGKSPEGVLSLSAEQRSGRILIRVADDGRGINRERVLAKAIEKGIVPPEAQLSDDEIDNLIFAPGFSTAQTVSNISGRGVGMDVVRQNVKDLGGRISIESRTGEGCVFTLALPLTLAISDGMTVNVGDQTLVVPLDHVVESLRPKREEIEVLSAGRQMLSIRGRFLPIVRLDGAAGATGAAREPHEGVLIVVQTESIGQAALLVDTICEQRQFVIKSLETHYRTVPGISGATILGDGRVALIVDVDGLVTDAATRAEEPARRAA